MKIALAPEVSKKISEAVFITGSIRSGTTMMWQLAATLERFECFQEPPLTYPLIPLIHDMPGDTWRLIFEAYLYEDCFLQSLAGRRLNLNRHDMSSAYNVLPAAEIERRLAKSYRRMELAPIGEGYRIGFKMPEMLPFLDRFKSYYPKVPTILMVRRPESIISSILAKGYYSDRQMRGAHTGEWLFRKGFDVFLPHWLPDEWTDEWVKIKEVERAALCFIYQYRFVLERTDCIFVDYDRFVAGPEKPFRALTERLGLRYGVLTETRLKSVGEPERDRAIPARDIRAQWRNEMAEIHARLAAKAFDL